MLSKDQISEFQAVQEAIKARQWLEAESQCRELLRKWPASAEALCSLASIQSECGDDMESIRLCNSAMYSDPNVHNAYQTLARSYYAMRRHGDAAEVYRRWAQVEPNDPEVQHMAAATCGNIVPPRCSDRYVRNHFNQFSATFDEVLVKRLGYNGPNVIRAALEKYFGDGATGLAVLDAGCGTGLCGVELRSMCAILVGVDLADKMIDKARERACYDELSVSELCTFMASQVGRYDAVVSSDVLIYFGALEEVARAAFSALKPFGIFAFTVEALPDGHNERYFLTTSGRYSHSKSYLSQAMLGAGFETLSIEEQPMRFELGKPVLFYVVIAQRFRGPD